MKQHLILLLILIALPRPAPPVLYGEPTTYPVPKVGAPVLTWQPDGLLLVSYEGDAVVEHRRAGVLLSAIHEPGAGSHRLLLPAAAGDEVCIERLCLTVDPPAPTPLPERSRPRVVLVPVWR